MEHEGQGTFYRGGRKLFESIKVDRILHDADTVNLGGVTLTAHRTAGHTPGCTSWSLRVMDGATPRDALILCQLSLPGNPTLVGDANYPDIPADFDASFALLKTLPCEVFLSEHGSVFDLEGKRRRMAAGDSNPYVDPAGCKRYLTQAEQDFRTELAAEQKSAH